MCEICGGPHFTVKCPQYEGSSAYYYANPYVQPQPYFSQGYSPYQYEEPYHQPQQQNSEAYDQDRLDRIMDNLAQLLATDETTQRMIQEHEVLLQNQQSIFPDIRRSLEEISRKLDEVEETKNMGIIDFGCEEEEIMMQLANCGIVRESDSDMQESQEEPETKMVDLDPPLVLHEEKEEKEERVEEPQKPAYGYTYDEEGNYLGFTIKTGELITSFPELGKEIYTDDLEDEEQNIPEPETTMDAEVPPPKPKDTEADFWSDSEDDEAEAEAWAAYQKEFLQRKKMVEEEVEVDLVDSESWLFNENVRKLELEEVDLGECLVWMFGEEKDNEVEMSEEGDTEESEENEFLDLDIGSLGGYEGVDAFESTIDMDYFDALLVEELEEIVEPTVIEELKCGDLPEEEVVVEEEEHHSWPVVVTEDESHSSPRLRERARSRGEPGSRGRFKLHRCSDERETTPLTFTHESSHYMHLISFSPGKFDYWWIDSLSNFNHYCILTKIGLLQSVLGQVELNGLEMVQIKEKPPD